MTLERTRYDVAVVGGGIVGLATALAVLEARPGVRLVVLEKEAALGQHQTGHNSGVLHAGVYYRPGSQKARLCVEGARALRAFCAQHGVPVEPCGKVIVATHEAELPRLAELERRGQANGVPLERIGPERLRELEPHAAGVAALWSPTTAIVDFRAVAEAIAGEVARRGGTVTTGARVVGIARERAGLRLETTRGEVATAYLVNCAGLYSDVVAALAGVAPAVRIVPFRGEYYRLRPERRTLVRGLIYPVPDPAFPFLGVHLTRTIHGEVEAGPNAVLAFAREGYTRWRVRPQELARTLGYRGFWAMGRRYWRTGLLEVGRSLSRHAFARALGRLVPAIRSRDLLPYGAGVRAQAVAPDGTLLDDFHIVEDARAVHVLNAPSPAATASLAIGRHIARLVTANVPA